MTQIINSYLQLMRAPAVFTALSNILAAHLIVTQGDIIWPGLLLLLGASAALYSSGMVLNDWFDYETDYRERPDRPLPSGKISRNHALLFAGLLLILGMTLAALAGTRSLYIALGIVILVLLYDGILKRTIAGSLAMGGCRYLNWLLGFSLLPLTELSLMLPIPVFLYIMALTLLSREEESAKNSTIVVFTAMGMIAAGLSIFAIAVLHDIPLGWDAFLVLFGIAFIVQRLWQTYQNFSPASVQSTIHLLLLAIIPLDFLLVIIFAPSWWALLVLALLLPGKFLARLMYVT